MVALKQFFGYLPGQTLKDFTAELKKLSTEEMDELAQLAAVELGVELKEAS
jgi:hypothetical protein